MKPRDVVAIGGSAGSLRPLRELVAALPADLPGSLLVTVHMWQHARSRLPWLLARAGPLAAAHAQTGEPLRPGRIYVAPPGCHLLMPEGVIELSNGPRINRSRPAIDAMFASAARWFGDRVVAVVLSGLLDDGAAGASLVAQAGGLVVVQDPEEAAQPSMPQAAQAATPGAITAPGAGLGEMVSAMLSETGLVARPRAEPHEVIQVSMEESSDLQFVCPGETRLTRLADPRAAVRSPKPSCHGNSYRCQGGHQFGPQSLAAAQTKTAEAKLWAAVAALEETALPAQHLATHTPTSEDFADQQNGIADWTARPG